MCLLFVYINPHPTPDSYSLIIANTRDEFCKRSTKQAGQWLPDHPHCVGGIDLERPGYGTWLASSESGRIAAVLNILSPKQHAQANSRGVLVSGYLTGTQDALSYLKSLKTYCNDSPDCLYNPFKLVLIESRKDCGGWNMYRWSNEVDQEIESYAGGVHVFCNSTTDARPWRKAIHGRMLFETLVGDCNHISKETELVNSLFTLLKDRTCTLPDPVLEEQGAFLHEVFPGRLAELSHIYVTSKDPDYGSRTQTVILVDHWGSCQFIEKTLKDPASFVNPEWLTTTICQKMAVGTATKNSAQSKSSL